MQGTICWFESSKSANVCPLRRDKFGALLFGWGHNWANIAIALAALPWAGRSYVPRSGPQSMEIPISQAGEPESLPYALVKMPPQLVRILGRYPPRLSTAFADRSPPK